MADLLTPFLFYLLFVLFFCFSVPNYRWRLTAAGTIVTSSLVFYPNHVATLLTDPAVFVSDMVSRTKKAVKE